MQSAKVNKKINFSVGYVIFTFLGIAVNTLFFIPTVSSAQQIFVIQGQAELFIPTDLLLLFGFIIAPIIYCSFASIALDPKTRVNPIAVQLGTIALVIIMTLVNLSGGHVPLNVQFVGVLSFLVMFSASFIALVGIFQNIVVGWVIRLNFEDFDSVSYLIPMKPKEILHKLGASFLDQWSFSRECDMGEIWVLESDNKDRCVLLEIGETPDNENKSVLATIAYEKSGDWIVRSKIASDVRNTIIKDIEERLNLKFRDNLIDLDNPVSRLADSNVKNLTRSRIEVTWKFFKNISKLFKVMVSLTIALLMGITILYFNFNQQVQLSSEAYIGIFIGLLIALFVEVGLPLRDELQKKRREEIEL
jgi:hypothetical protein